MNWQDPAAFETWPQHDQDQFSVNVVKGLIMDSVRNANSGHTGGPMSSADFAVILFKEFLNICPHDPQWLNRDRFVLSAGHESMLLYTLLTLAGYLELEDLKAFRQLGSRTPGHPERGLTPGVEATTGPLGQGVAMAVGMAAAESILQNILGPDIIDHQTYILASDGDLQEPVTLGAAAIAGHLGLGKLIMYYDSNEVQISGATSRADSTDYATVFKGLHWQVLEVGGHDHATIRSALREGVDELGKPTLIIGHSVMAKGSHSMENNADTHGAPLPEEEILATKAKLGLPPERFYLPDGVVNHMRRRYGDLRQREAGWRETVNEKMKSAEFSWLWQQVVDGILPALKLPAFEAGQMLPTRKAFGDILVHLAEAIPNLVGGSADLEPSNNTAGFAGIVGDYGRQTRKGRNIAFGVREFPMGAILNGMALHGGIRPFGATFLVFSDYERPALRLRALQELPVAAIYTHDSFYLGKDGPTHQPVEQLSTLRAIPNFLVLRPADGNETAVAMEVILEQEHRPSALLLSRQSLPVLDRRKYSAADGARRGAYILKDSTGDPDLILIATGSEVSLALQTAELLPHLNIRIVSMPSWELFDEQDQPYREEVLGSDGVVRISIEAGLTYGWKKHTGDNGLEIGLDHFGASADPADLAAAYGFTPEAVAEKIRAHLEGISTMKREE